jgi:long-chain fatty acid transport protein
VLVCAASSPKLAGAGGIELYEIATPDVGLASAGYAARAQDASTLFKNPAGMSKLPGTQFEAGLQLTYGHVQFTPNGNTSPLLGNDDGGNPVGALPAASLFLTHQISDNLTVGVGTFSYFGLATTYNSEWLGRYYIQKGSLIGLSLMPAFSFKPADWFSIGAGLNAMYGYMNSQVAIRTAPSATGDGQMVLKNNTWGFGANAGILVEPREGTRIGVTYLSAVKLDFSAKPGFSNLGPLGGLPIFTTPPQLNLGITVPQSVMLGGYQDLSDKWAIMGDVGWQNWEQFGKVDVGVDSNNPQGLTANLQYQNTWHGALGAQYKLSDEWKMTGGVAYDSSCVTDANRTLSLPVGKAYRFGLGTEWQVSRMVAVDASYEFMWAGDMPVTQDSAYRGNVSGSYNDTWFSFFTVGINCKF